MHWLVSTPAGISISNVSISGDMGFGSAMSGGAEAESEFSEGDIGVAVCSATSSRTCKNSRSSGLIQGCTSCASRAMVSQSSNFARLFSNLSPSHFPRCFRGNLAHRCKLVASPRISLYLLRMRQAGLPPRGSTSMAKNVMPFVVTMFSAGIVILQISKAA